MTLWEKLKHANVEASKAYQLHQLACDTQNYIADVGDGYFHPDVVAEVGANEERLLGLFKKRAAEAKQAQVDWEKGEGVT